MRLRLVGSLCVKPNGPKEPTFDDDEPVVEDGAPGWWLLPLPFPLLWAPLAGCWRV